MLLRLRVKSAMVSSALAAPVSTGNHLSSKAYLILTRLSS